MYVNALPPFEWRNPNFQEAPVKVLFPEVATEGVPTKGESQRADRTVVLADPRLGPPLLGELGPSVYLGNSAVAKELGLNVCAQRVCLRARTIGEKGK